MSNALAVGAVSAVLRDLLNNGLIDHNLAAAVGNVTVSVRSPDQLPVGPTDEESRLNLFLYQVTPNQGWRNVGLPSRDANGQRVSNPPLALDLHYLLTAYGAEDFHAEILLGFAMQLFHETPVLTRDGIRTALGGVPPVSGAGVLPPPFDALAASELADQIEQIKITPEALDGEAMSRLWSAIQAHYRPTAAYQASVVLIESRASTRSAPPVRERGVYVLPFRQPLVEQVLSADGESVPIVVGSMLAIRGQRLRGEVTRVLIGAAEVEPSLVSDAELRLPLAEPPLPPETLRAGVMAVQAVYPVLMGTPPVAHRGFESNVAPFVLRPTITTVAAASVTPMVENGSPVIVDGVQLVSATINLTLRPRVGRSQRVVLLLNELAAPAAAAYSFVDEPRPADSANLSIPVTRIRPSTYLVRAQVDGAESPLPLDGDPASPTFGQMIPQVSIA